MMTKSLRFSLAALACVVFSSTLPCAAQAGATSEDALTLTTEFAPDTFDAEELRAALERELSIPVQHREQTSRARLEVTASSKEVVRVAFVRADGQRVERSVDVSSSGVHAIETLALLAANLMRDEAADLLASLRPPSEPAPAAPPAPAVVAPPPPPLPTGCAANQLRLTRVGVDFVPYLGTSAAQGTAHERRFSFNVLGGVAGGVRGVEFGGIWNFDAHSVCGAQFAGVLNLVGGPVQGAQFGLLNFAGSRVDGAQFGLIAAGGPLTGAQFGLIAIAGGAVTGAQFSLLNLAGSELTGAQYGLVNIAGGGVLGVQGGLVNVHGGDTRGLQLGLASVSPQGVHGAQLGLVNLSGQGVRGLQLGLVNVSADRVSGAAIGLVNVAPDADFALGLVNVLWRGRTHLDVWGTDFGTFHIGIEHGSRVMHNIYSIGLGSRDGRVVFAPTYGVGARVFQSRWLFLDIDALAHGLMAYDSGDNRLLHTLVAQLRVPVSLRILPEVAVFVSPALNVSVSDTDNELLPSPSLYGSSRLTNRDSNVTVRLRTGFTLGARFF